MAGLGQLAKRSDQINLWVISGERGVGKTTFCQNMVKRAILKKWNVAGILSLAVIVQGEKIAINANDLRNNKQCRLAQRMPSGLAGSIHTDTWHFDEDVLEWGNEVFRTALPCDLLVVDELGPLELERKQGWMAALDAIHSKAYRFCLLVLRPDLLDAFRKHGEAFMLIELPEQGRQFEQGDFLFGS